MIHDTPHSIIWTGQPPLPPGEGWGEGNDQRWPVIENIPFLRLDRRELATQALIALDADDPDTALALLLGDQDNWARTPPPTEQARRALIRDAGRITFREAMARLEFGPVATYFAHRWSDPTFLSGLALAEAHWTAPTHVFELACGAGHYLREFARHAPHVTGADIVFAKLWLARRYIAPTATLICFDAAQPWPIATASQDLMFCHDAFYFLPNKPAIAAEMRRVTQGPILIGHAHNALTENLSAGEPLTPTAYAALFGTPYMYDDRELTAALIESRAPAPATLLDTAPAISMAADALPPRPVEAGLAIPPPGTPLRRNPLYAGSQIRFPSDRYATEYGPLATYPMQTDAPDTARLTAATAQAARNRTLLDLPTQW